MKAMKISGFLLLWLLVLYAHAQDYFLIVAPDEFMDELEVLKNYKDCSGRPTYLVSLSFINSTYTGVDLPEKVKKCIAEYKQYFNIKYVLLAGDSDKFPVRYCRAYNTEWGSKYYPSDLYYADLFDSWGSFDNWDGDNDGIIGEMDFAGGDDINLVNLDDIDMYPDVSLARVPASTSTELTTYINKVIDYELSAPGIWFNRAMLLVDGHSSPFGDTSKVNEDVLPYLQSAGFSIYKRYMNDPAWTGLTYTQRSAEVSAKLNAGLGFVNYYGHGNRHWWTNKYDDGWFDDSKIPALTNDHVLPVMLASSCLTGRFHFDREYYMGKNGVEWNRLAGPWPVVNYPEPMAVQPSTYDSYDDESMAEHFLVKNDGGAIGYIGVTSISEHGLWLSDPTKSIGLAPYFFQDYYNGNRTLGILWRNALSTFIDDVEDIGMYYYAFLHIHKMMLFGDPSLTVGGRYTNYLSGSYYDGNGGPWTAWSRGRVTGTVTVPAGQKLTVNQGVSILFNQYQKITALDPNYEKGLLVNGTYYAPVSFFSKSPDPQVDYYMHGMKVQGEARVRNGGEIKLY